MIFICAKTLIMSALFLEQPVSDRDDLCGPLDAHEHHVGDPCNRRSKQMALHLIFLDEKGNFKPHLDKFQSF